MLKERNVFVTLDESEKLQTEGGGTVGLTGGLAMNLPGFSGSTGTNNNVSAGSSALDYRLHIQAGCKEYYECAVFMPDSCPYH